MSLSRRRLTVGGILLFLVLLIAVLLLLVRPAGALDVTVTADPPTLGLNQTARISVSVRRGKSPACEDRQRCTWVWKADGGEIYPEVGQATFRATRAGVARVTVQVEERKRRGEASASLLVSPDAALLGRGPTTDGELPPKPAPEVPPPETMDGPPPVIDAIEVEKTEVCRGEAVLVRVRSHDPRGSEWDPWLHYLVDGNPGHTQPVFYRMMDRSNTPRFVTVYGKNSRTWVTQQIPTVKYKDCDAPRFAAVAHALVPNTQDDFVFRVTVKSRPEAPRFTPASFEWDFADGSKETTSAPFVEHSYLHRKQESLESNFIVAVRVTSAEGETLLGRDGLTLRNEAWETRAAGQHVSLVIELSPRYPKRDPDGHIRQNVRIWHHDPAPVTVERVTTEDYTNQGDKVADASMSPAQLMGTSSIPREGVTFAVELEPGEAEYILFRRFVLEGKAADGLPIHGTFPLMVPSKLDRATAIRYDDPMEKMRVRMAIKLLGRPEVTDEDLMQLEREGKIPKLPARRPPDRPGTPAPSGTTEAKPK
jgi:hypothetical protein